jgi:hypothetical protein
MSKDLVKNIIFESDLDVDIYREYLSNKNNKYLSYIEFYILLEPGLIKIENLKKIKRLKKLKECFWR